MMNIRTKFLIPLFVLVTILVVHINYVWSPKLYSYIKAEGSDHLQSHLSTVADSLVPLLLEKQLAAVYENLDTMLESNPDWRKIYLFNDSGKILYPFQVIENIDSSNKYELLLVQPITYLDQKLGKLKVVIDVSRDYEQIKAFQNEMIRIFLYGLSIFSLAMILLFRYIIHKPIQQLSSASDSLANGEFNSILPQTGKDEVGKLVSSFSTMRDSIQAYQLKLQNEIGEHKITAHELLSEKEKATYQAAHDALTGLVNRREFEIRLNRLLDLAIKESTSHAMLYIDLDQFKVVNDTCGHAAGDALLRQLSAMLQHKIREGDTLARLGGDEFGLLIEHCSLDDAEKIANQLKEQIQDFHYEWNDNLFRVGASIGLVAINKNSGSVDLIMRAADTACYAAKDTGRNKVHVYKLDDKEMVTRHGEMQWVARISSALDKNQFALFQQPVMLTDKPHSKIEYYEILVRMQDDNGKLIPPGAFLPAAERYSLAQHIDRYVIGEVFKYISKNKNAESKVFGINLSQTSIGEEGFLAFILRMIKRYNISGRHICFEITETAAVMDLNIALQFITALRGYGCRFALDDFGRGLSSLVYLKTLPVDYLKIDGLFVKDIITDAVDLAMVKSIHEIGNVMNMKTIAEFVESEDIYLQLKEIGVDCIQGNWVAQPIRLLTEESEPTKVIEAADLMPG